MFWSRSLPLISLYNHPLSDTARNSLAGEGGMATGHLKERPWLLSLLLYLFAAEIVVLWVCCCSRASDALYHHLAWGGFLMNFSEPRPFACEQVGFNEQSPKPSAGQRNTVALRKCENAVWQKQSPEIQPGYHRALNALPSIVPQEKAVANQIFIDFCFQIIKPKLICHLYAKGHSRHLSNFSCLAIHYLVGWAK